MATFNIIVAPSVGGVNHPFGGALGKSAIAAILTAAWSVDHHPNGGCTMGWKMAFPALQSGRKSQG